MRTLRHNPGRDLPGLVEPETVMPRRRRWGWWLLAVGVIGVAGVAAAVTTDDSLSKVPGTVRLTGAAKAFTLEDVRAGRPPVSLEALRGKPVVLNFFGSWCPPCVREMPALQAMSERYRDRVAFVGVTFNDGREAAQGVLERTGATYPAAFDAKSELANDYGLRVMPTTWFIDARGNLLERKDGEFSEVQLRTTIDRLFGSESDRYPFIAGSFWSSGSSSERVTTLSKRAVTFPSAPMRKTQGSLTSSPRAIHSLAASLSSWAL